MVTARLPSQKVPTGEPLKAPASRLETEALVNPSRLDTSVSISTSTM